MARASEQTRSEGSSAPGEEPLPRILWVIVAVAVGVRVAVAAGSRFTNEDFMITLRYAENIARGQGFVYNPGERVLGTTTPLYTLFVALAAWSGLPATSTGKAANILADGALCLVIYQWLRLAGQEPAGRLAAFWVAVNPLHVRWAVSGMETSLVTLCGALAWLAWMQRRYRAAYAVLAILFLLRWDSVLLLGVLTAALVWRERRLPVAELLLYGVLVAPWLLFATGYFGSPIPVTAAAKLAVYGSPAASVFPQSPGLVYRLFGAPEYAFGSVLALAGLLTVRRERLASLWPPITWFGAYGAALALSRVPLFEWYLVPPLPVHDVLASLGALSVLRWAAVRGPERARRAGGWAVVCLLALFAGWRSFEGCRNTQRIEEHLRKPLGRWLQAQSKPGDRIMLEPIGYIGYYSRRPVLDVIGLVSPQALPFWKSGSASPLLDLARAFRPEWCVLRPREAANVREAARRRGGRWEGEYALVRTFSYARPGDREPLVFHVFRRSSYQPPGRQEPQEKKGKENCRG
jgi:hypothetical protein